MIYHIDSVCIIVYHIHCVGHLQYYIASLALKKYQEHTFFYKNIPVFPKLIDIKEQMRDKKEYKMA